MTKLWAMPVRHYATNKIVTVRPLTPLIEVYDLLLELDISAVPVVDEREGLVGILSTTDVVREARIEITAPGDLARVTPPPRNARDLMRRQVVSVDAEAPLSEAAAAMLEHRIHRVVVTCAGTAVGMLTTRDAMRAVLERRVELQLEAVMSSPVETIEQGDSIRTAIERLDDANVRGLVVVDDRWPVGVFTHTEAIHARALPPLFLDTPVERVMSYETICLDIATPLYRVAGHSIQMGVRRILAVHQRQLRGIVSPFDLLRVMVT